MYDKNKFSGEYFQNIVSFFDANIEQKPTIWKAKYRQQEK
jgi:hypothetical protein